MYTATIKPAVQILPRSVLLLNALLALFFIALTAIAIHLSMLDPSPLLPVIRCVGIIRRDADGFVFDFFRENEVEDDGYEGRDCVGGNMLALSFFLPETGLSDVMII